MLVLYAKVGHSQNEAVDENQFYITDMNSKASFVTKKKLFFVCKCHYFFLAMPLN